MQRKLANGQWKWEFQLFFNNLFTSSLVLVFWGIMRLLNDGFGQENTESWWRDSKMPGTWAIFSCSRVWLQPPSFILSKHRCRALCLLDHRKYPIGFFFNVALIWMRVFSLIESCVLCKRPGHNTAHSAVDKGVNHANVSSTALARKKKCELFWTL